MRQAPWIPAPCKATVKRFRKGNLCSRHRRVSFRSVSQSARHEHREEEKLFVGTDGRDASDFLTWENRMGDGSPNGQNGEFRLLNNLQHIKTLYTEAETRIEALKREVTICKDELFRTRMELDSEKDARRSAENRLQTMSSSVRELERVVDAQKDYIREIRFARTLNHQNVQHIKPRPNGLVTSSEDDGNWRARNKERKMLRGGKQTTGTMTGVITSDASVQTVRVLQNQSAQTKTLADRHAQTATTFGETDLRQLKDQLESERQLTQHLRSKLNDYEKTKGSIGKEKNGKATEINGGRNQRSENQKVSFGDGAAGSQENVKEILTTLQKLEEEVGDLRKRLRQQKLVNQALKQYFRTLESSYVSLFT